MKYFRLNEKVYAFEADGSQDSFITSEMVEMTADEIDRHINPQNYLTAEQIQVQYMKSLRPLTRRQFKLVLLQNGLLDDIDTAIANIADATQKAIIEIEYQESTTFERTNPSVLAMMAALGLSEAQVNTMWEQAMVI